MTGPRAKPKPILTLKRRRGATSDEPPAQPPEERLLSELQAMAGDVWDARAPAPLAVGIHKQLNPIAERLGMSRRGLRRFLSRWTASAAYQRAVGESGARRFNADGSVAGPVSAEHAERARQAAQQEQPEKAVS